MVRGKRIMKQHVNILDCTLRDGGYFNNWNFQTDLVQTYLKAVKESQIKYVEIGLRCLEKNDDYGIFAYCPDEFLESLEIPEGLELAVMIKAEEILAAEDVEKTLNILFTDAKDSPVSTVRVAVFYQEGLSAYKIIEILKNKGYRTALNLTKIHPGCEEKLSAVAEAIQSWECLDALYFADSFGELDPDDIKKDMIAIKKVNGKPLGFHGHNNREQAYANAVAAIENGSSYIDSTVTGLGKGAGNLKTEEIIKDFPEDYDIKPLMPIVEAIKEMRNRK